MARNNAAGQERRGMTHWLIKRRERSLAGLVFFMIFTTSLLLQVSAQSCEESSEEQKKTQTIKHHTKKRRSGCYAIHLKANSVDSGHAVVWMKQQLRSKIRLDQDGTELLIPRKGYYLINLRMTYRVPADKCPCVGNGERTAICYLTLSVMEKSSAYPEWLNVVEAKETMTCNEGSSHTINLVRVIFLIPDTKIRVKVDPKNHQLISLPSDNFNFFEVIRL